MKTVAQQIKETAIALYNSVSNPRQEAKIILAQILGCAVAEVSLYEPSITDEDINKINKIVQRRVKGEPLQYVLNSAPFMGMDFEVGRGVLIPRPETEILVENTIFWITNHKNYCSSPVQVIDMCTGCGNIAISIAKQVNNVHVLASDISEHSRIFVRKNLRNHRLINKVDFIQSDMGKQIQKHYAETMGKWDVIVSNPPYVPGSVYAKMPREVVDYEPREALLSGSDGLSHFRKILEFGLIALRTGGLIAVELFEQSLDDATTLAQKSGYANIKIVHDLASRPRVLMCEKPNNIKTEMD